MTLHNQKSYLKMWTYYVQAIDCCTVTTQQVTHTHKFLTGLAKAFLIVFNKCGGSEKKKMSLFVYMLVVLYMRLCSGQCKRNIFLLIDASSAVMPITLIPLHASRSIACHTNGKRMETGHTETLYRKISLSP